VLVVALGPIPEAVPLEPGSLSGRSCIPLAPSNGTATVGIPFPANAIRRDNPLVFVRALFVDPALRRVVAASNSFVVTLD
jgi:hypothetical protein